MTASEQNGIATYCGIVGIPGITGVQIQPGCNASYDLDEIKNSLDALNQHVDKETDMLHISPKELDQALTLLEGDGSTTFMTEDSGSRDDETKVDQIAQLIGHLYNLSFRIKTFMTNPLKDLFNSCDEDISPENQPKKKAIAEQLALAA